MVAVAVAAPVPVPAPFLAEAQPPSSSLTFLLDPLDLLLTHLSPFATVKVLCTPRRGLPGRIGFGSLRQWFSHIRIALPRPPRPCGVPSLLFRVKLQHPPAHLKHFIERHPRGLPPGRGGFGKGLAQQARGEEDGPARQGGRVELHAEGRPEAVVGHVEGLLPKLRRGAQEAVREEEEKDLVGELNAHDEAELPENHLLRAHDLLSPPLERGVVPQE